jgi:hypothetical protein
MFFLFKLLFFGKYFVIIVPSSSLLMYQENPKREKETTPLPREKKRDNKVDMDRPKGTWVDIKFSSKMHERKII